MASKQTDGMSDRVRVIRMIEYVGTREKVEDTLKRSLHGSIAVPDLVVSVATLGEFPEVLADRAPILPVPPERRAAAVAAFWASIDKTRIRFGDVVDGQAEDVQLALDAALEVCIQVQEQEVNHGQ